MIGSFITSLLGISSYQDWTNTVDKQVQRSVTVIHLVAKQCYFGRSLISVGIEVPPGSVIEAVGTGGYEILIDFAASSRRGTNWSIFGFSTPGKVT